MSLRLSKTARKRLTRASKKAAKAAIPMELLENFEVSLAGGQVCLWKEESEGRYNSPFHITSDMDFLCCGHVGSTTVRFTQFVQESRERLEEEGCVISHEHAYEHHCARIDHSIWIVDMCLMNPRVRFSFIQCPGTANGLEAVQQFDFTMVRMIHDFKNDDFVMDAECRRDWDARVINISQAGADRIAQTLNLRPEDPAWRRVTCNTMVRSTHFRVRKCIRRGFRMINMHHWMVEMEEAIGDRWEWEEPWDWETLLPTHNVHLIE